MSRPVFFIWVIGHNASGKTTLSTKLADYFRLNRVNGDDFRDFLGKNYLYFKNLEYSKKAHPKYGSLNVVTQDFRTSIASELLKQNQDIIYDGSGYNQEVRSSVLKTIKERSQTDFKTIFIRSIISEDELIKRLRIRDAKEGNTWEKKYLERNKSYYKLPEANECDVLIDYNQSNYDEVKSKLETLLSDEIK